MGVTPVMAAGYAGAAEVLAYLLTLRPDLSHVNTYGGTLLTTLLHGAETCPGRATGDYPACLRLVLTAGVPLPKAAMRAAGRADLRALMQDWAEAHPAQLA